MKKFLPLLLLLALIAASCCHARAAEKKFMALASTFPVYLFTANVCAGIPDVEVNLLVPSAAGCPHDFALRPGDMRKLASADALVINGAGLEDFLEKTLHSAAPNLPVINAGQNVPLAADDHYHNGKNPHIFAAPDTAVLMVRNIADRLGELLPANAGHFQDNAQKYASSLSAISARLAAIGQKSADKRIALEHDALVYLARNADLDIVAVFEHASSAARLAALGKDLEKARPIVLAGDAQYPDKLLRTLSEETGIPFIVLNSCSGGPENAPLDYYQLVMEKNLKTLEASFE